MSLTTKEVAELKKIVARANVLIAKASGDKDPKGKTSARRTVSSGRRRTGKELEAVPVAQLARKHGITPAYIYQMG
jgi:hypothetical protein